MTAADGGASGGGVIKATFGFGGAGGGSDRASIRTPTPTPAVGSQRTLTWRKPKKGERWQPDLANGWGIALADCNSERWVLEADTAEQSS